MSITPLWLEYNAGTTRRAPATTTHEQPRRRVSPTQLAGASHTAVSSRRLGPSSDILLARGTNIHPEPADPAYAHRADSPDGDSRSPRETGFPRTVSERADGTSQPTVRDASVRRSNRAMRTMASPSPRSPARCAGVPRRYGE